MNKQLNTSIQFCTTSADLVRNIFLKQPFSTKSSDLNCLLLIGHASRPYNSTGRHFDFKQPHSHFFRSNASNFSNPNIALKARQKDFLAFANEQAKALADVMITPKYLIDSSHLISLPSKVDTVLQWCLKREPIRTHTLFSINSHVQQSYFLLTDM